MGGFRGRVVPEGEGGWAEISTPDAIVRYYDPTDVFGDLAEAIADAYPNISDEDEDLDGAGGGAESAEAGDGSEEGNEAEDGSEGDEAEDDEEGDADEDDEFAAVDRKGRE
jgi:hypothetical protein